MPTDNPLNPATVAQLDVIKGAQLRIIADGMLNSIEQGAPSLAHGMNLPDDCVLVVCGRGAYSKLVSLHEQHLEVKSADVAASAIGKAKAS